MCSIVRCDICGKEVPVCCAKVIASDGKCKCTDCIKEGDR